MPLAARDASPRLAVVDVREVRCCPPTAAAFQENGQRRYGGPPPDWNGPPPERGSEIFVGKLPRDLFEDELVPLCEKVTEGRARLFDVFDLFVAL